MRVYGASGRAASARSMFELNELTSGVSFPQEPSEPEERESDVSLMLRAKAGDDAAFETLFARHVQPLVSFAYRFTGDRSRAEEIVQDAFLQIFRARSRYEASACFTTFAYRVVTNLCLNEARRMRSQRRIFEVTFADEGAGMRDYPDHRVPPPEDRINGAEIAERLTDALRELPPTQRAAVLLTRFEGMSYEDTADYLGTSQSAIKSLVFRATVNLRKALGDLMDADQLIRQASGASRLVASGSRA